MKKTVHIEIDTHQIPMEVERAAKLLTRFFALQGHEYWGFLGVCSNECVTTLRIQNISLRGQLRGLQFSYRKREKQLDSARLKAHDELQLVKWQNRKLKQEIQALKDAHFANQQAS